MKSRPGSFPRGCRDGFVHLCTSYTSALPAPPELALAESRRRRACLAPARRERPVMCRRELARHPVHGRGRTRADAVGELASSVPENRGAPDAVQVADRFHSWQGLGRAVETCVAAHRECLRAPAPPRPPNPDTTPDDSGRVSTGRAGRRAQRKKAANTLVHELLAQGHSRRAIARWHGPHTLNLRPHHLGEA